MMTGRCVRCGRPVVGQGGSICSRCEKNVAQEAARKAKRQARRERLLRLSVMFGAPHDWGAVLPGRHITDRQARLFMDLRTTHTQKLAAAKAGISVASARRIEADPRPPSTRKPLRTWRTRGDPLALVWDDIIVPIRDCQESCVRAG